MDPPPRVIGLPRRLARPSRFLPCPRARLYDAPAGRTLRHRVGRMPRSVPRLMERAYEGDATRQLAVE
jgi:hypothetical protein